MWHTRRVPRATVVRLRSPVSFVGIAEQQVGGKQGQGEYDGPVWNANFTRVKTIGSPNRPLSLKAPEPQRPPRRLHVPRVVVGIGHRPFDIVIPLKIHVGPNGAEYGTSCGRRSEDRRSTRNGKLVRRHLAPNPSHHQHARHPQRHNARLPSPGLQEFTHGSSCLGCRTISISSEVRIRVVVG